MKRKLCKLITVFLLCKLNMFSQTAGFHYEATLQPVDSSGFYSVVLTPELNAHLKTDYSDLRIVNDSGKWVPHVITYPNGRITHESVVFQMKILKKEDTKQNTEMVLQGNDTGISNIRIVVKNTTAKRFCTLSGSDDGNAWFVINDSIEMKVESGNDNNSYIDLFFPAVNYRYFRIVINNNGKEPLNIVSAGTSGIVNTSPKGLLYPPIENPTAKFFQKDSNKVSYIRVEQPASYHFTKLSLKVSGVKYFNRQAALYVPSSANHSIANPGAMVTSFTISNNSTLEYRVPQCNARVFYILIHNDDNLPLKTEQVKTFADYTTAAVYLDKGRQYKILLDNATATIPGYDISIKDIPADNVVPITEIGKITSLTTPAAITKKEGDSQNMIWLLIAVATAVLGFFTYRLITDMKRSES